MVKTLTDKFKIGKSKGEKLDLVTAVNGGDYEAKFNEIYSDAQRDREKYEKLLNRYSDGDILKQEKKNYGFGKGIKKAVATALAITGLTLIGCASPTGYEKPEEPTEPPIDKPEEPNNPTEPTNPKVKYTINGYLQDNETDSNRSGEVICYVDGIEHSRDSDGNDFSFEVPENSEVRLEGRMKNGAVDKSYKRTIKFNDIAENKTGIELRCVPFDGDLSYDDGLTDVYGNSLQTLQGKENFKEHMRRVNFNGLNGEGFPMVTGNMNNGLKKWNHGEVSEQSGRPIFQGIEVNSNFATDSLGGREGFTQEEYNTIVNAIRNSKHINANTINIIYGNSHQGKGGWGNVRHISKSPDGPATITMDEIGLDGYIEKYIVYTNLEPRTINHEDEHGLLFPGHASEWDLEKEGYAYQKLFDSLMVYSTDDDFPAGDSAPRYLRSADIKANYIVDEPTYLGMESIENILGL